MATIVEVAQRAGVSIATVSNVIRGTKRVSPAVHARVQTAIRELDYYPNEIARSLKVKQTRMLGSCFPTSPIHSFQRSFAERKKATAVFICNGVMTLGFLKALGESGKKCPEDISLATFDDLAVDRSFHPHLTAVVQPSYEMGARAATILMDRIEGKRAGDASAVRIVPTLVIRESTRRPAE